MAKGYKLKYTHAAAEQLERLPHEIASQMMRKLEWLASNVSDLKHEAMKGNWESFFRIRMGDYRAIYSLDHANQVVEVEAIGHRGKVYGG